MSPVKSELTDDEVFAGMGKRNLDNLIEDFGTDKDSEWVGKSVVVSSIMIYTMRGGTTKGIIWNAANEG